MQCHYHVYLILIEVGPSYVHLDKGQKSELQDLQKGQSHVYPYIVNDPLGPKRTENNYLIDLKKSELTKNSVNGVKGPCPLSKLKYFHHDCDQ